MSRHYLNEKFMFKKALLISMIALVVTGCQSTVATSQASRSVEKFL